MNDPDDSNKVFKLNEDPVIVDGEDFLVRTKSCLAMTVTPDRASYINEKYVSSKYYNGFNFYKLPADFRQLQMAFGITSPQTGAGKTLIASNMAVSLAQAYERRTVLVDLNFKKPMLHQIFGVKQSPGVVEALQGEKVKMTLTAIDNLYLLPSGNIFEYEPGVADVSVLRKIITTLKNSFDFVIVDMNSILPVKEYPVLFANEMDGLFAVVDTQTTKKDDLDKIYRHVSENQVVGYIFNKVDKNNSY